MKFPRQLVRTIEVKEPHCHLLMPWQHVRACAACPERPRSSLPDGPCAIGLTSSLPRSCCPAQVLRQQINKGEGLCAIFTGSAGTAGPLLLPTVDTLGALLEGPRAGPYNAALLELILIMPCRFVSVHTSPFWCHACPPLRFACHSSYNMAACQLASPCLLVSIDSATVLLPEAAG